MNSAAQAYSNTSRVAPLTPRQLEATLLLKAAAQLQAVKSDWDNRQDDLFPAVEYNQKLWTILATSATSPENPLPVEIKQNVGNLAVFVLSQLMSIVANPESRKLDSVININRELASGLR